LLRGIVSRCQTGSQGCQLIPQRRGTDTHFYLKDGQQGSTRLLVNASGSLLNTYHNF
jgi:hypothetical protein